MSIENEPKPISEAMKEYWKNIRKEGLSMGDHYETLDISPRFFGAADHDEDHSCPQCGGLGLVRRDYPVGHPDFGKLWPCPENCKTVQQNQQRKLDKIIQDAGIPPMYRSFTFTSWERHIGLDTQGKVDAYKAAHSFAHHPMHFVFDRYGDNPKHSLILHGPVGVGKTGLMVSIANVLMERGESVLYVRCDDLLESVRKGYKTGNASEVLEHVRSFPLLLLDEFNLDEFQTERTSRDKRRIIESIIRYRYGNALPLVATTNLEPDVFAQEWGERITDPLRQIAHWVNLGGVNLRGTLEE